MMIAIKGPRIPDLDTLEQSRRGLVRLAEDCGLQVIASFAVSDDVACTIRLRLADIAAMPMLAKRWGQAVSEAATASVDVLYSDEDDPSVEGHKSRLVTFEENEDEN